MKRTLVAFACMAFLLFSITGCEKEEPPLDLFMMHTLGSLHGGFSAINKLSDYNIKGHYSCMTPLTSEPNSYCNFYLTFVGDYYWTLECWREDTPWYADGLTRIDKGGNLTHYDLPLGRITPPLGLDYGNGYLWYGDYSPEGPEDTVSLYKIDPSNVSTATYALTIAIPASLGRGLYEDCKGLEIDENDNLIWLLVNPSGTYKYHFLKYDLSTGQYLSELVYTQSPDIFFDQFEPVDFDVDANYIWFDNDILIRMDKTDGSYIAVPGMVQTNPYFVEVNH